MCTHCLCTTSEIYGTNLLGEDVCSHCGVITSEGEFEHKDPWKTNQIDSHNRSLRDDKTDSENNSED